jgi:hypothetical protein
LTFDIATQSQQVSLTVYQAGLEAAVEHRPHQAVATVEVLREDAVDMTHQPRKIRATRVQHQMEMLAHQAVGEHLRVKATHGLRNDGELHGSVSFVAIDRTATSVTTRSHVIHGTGKLNAQGAAHGLRLLRRWGKWEN